MIEFISLASSSHGNAYVVDNGKSRILLECGIPFKKLQQLLNYDIGKIDFCLLTHEHTDHAKAARKVLEYGIPIYMSEGTALMLDLENDVNVHILSAKKTAHIYGYKVLPFQVRHDAAEPFGFLICEDSDENPDKLLFATDTSNIEYRFPSLTYIALECNYDEALINHDEAESWQYRAMQNHMGIDTLCRYLGKTDLSKVRRIYLLHMSDRHGSEASFVGRVYKEFGIPVTACGAEYSVCNWKIKSEVNCGKTVI